MTPSLSDLSPRDRLAAAWGMWRAVARAKQLAPTGMWLVWLILSGRGWGKTRTGAEQVVKWALELAGARIAIIAATFDDGRDVMMEGDSGVVSVLYRYGFTEGKTPAPGVYTWNRSLGQLILPNGSRMDLYSGQKPRQLRGPQHHYAWCDELPHWAYPRKTWSNMLFGLRLKSPTGPRVIVTTTPLPIPLIRELMGKANTVVTRGSTYENADNLADVILDELRDTFEGTEEGRQELYGEVLSDVKGALMSQAILAQCLHPVPVPELDRLVVSVDPAVEDDPDVNDATGYAVVGAGYPVHPEAMHPDKLHLYVLHSDQVWLAPEPAMKMAGDLVDAYDADHVTIEANNGGQYLPAVLRIMCPGVPWRTVKAVGGAQAAARKAANNTNAKLDRARALKALAEQGRVHIVGDRQGVFGDECTTYTGAKGQPSPNVLDAVVWGQHDVLPVPLVAGRERKPAQSL